MIKYSKEELADALKVVSATILKCEKFQPKFKEGTSQHSLLKNRIKALNISKALIAGENIACTYTKEDLIKALSPVTSIINKCEKAIEKFDEGTGNYTRLKKIIDAMYISKSFIKNEIIKNLQREIEKDYPLKTLHILNGLCMLESFQKNNLINERAVYVPFNEAMCWGETHEEIFSPEFIERRADSLKSTSKEYRKIVIEPLKPLFDEKFDIIVLWFGDDMFCQMNFITILAYLEQIHFEGDVLFCMCQEQEQIDEMLSNALEIDISGYKNIYETILCCKEKCDAKLLPVTYQAMNLYLGYKERNSDIKVYIKNNLNKKNLVEELIMLFPQYGFGDSQYKWMIEEIKLIY